VNPQELKHRIAFGERQWEWCRLKVLQNQLEAQLLLTKGEDDKAKHKLEVAERYIEFLDECNASIDGNRRSLEPSQEDLLRDGVPLG
jgi:hypothetical protein